MSFTAPIFTELTIIQYLPRTELSKSDKKDVQNRARFHLRRELTYAIHCADFHGTPHNCSMPLIRTPSTPNFITHGLLRHAG